MTHTSFGRRRKGDTEHDKEKNLSRTTGGHGWAYRGFVETEVATRVQLPINRDRDIASHTHR